MKNNPKLFFDEWMFARSNDPIVNPVYNAIYNTRGQQVVDATLHAAKSVSAQSSFDDLFKTDDSISVGLTNVANAQLPAGQYFAVNAISLQYAVAAGTTEANVKAADFKTLLPAAISNGETSIAVDKKPILEKILNEVFANAEEYVATGDTNASAGTPVTYTLSGGGKVGYYELDNCKMIQPNQIIEIKEKFAAAAASNAALRIIFHGCTNVTA